MDLGQQEFNNKKIDVCINVYGKPYQTLVTLKSLLNHSGHLIDKIYFIEERSQPEDYNYNFIKESLNYSNLERYVPKHYLWVNHTDLNRVKKQKDYRMSLRYQYGLENTNKKYLLIIHNDVLFNDDIVFKFLNEIDNSFTIGHIGQCWNCPMKYEGICDSDLLQTNLDNKMDYDKLTFIINKYPNTRTSIFGKNFLNKENPFPMPECRVNEWCTLINVEYYRNETIPHGNIVPFGGYFGLDISDKWFRQMVDKGYSFKHINIYDYCTHAYFSENGNGHSSDRNTTIYNNCEQKAKIFFETNYK